MGDDAEPDEIRVVGVDADAREGEEMLGGVGWEAQGEEECAEEREPTTGGERVRSLGSGDDGRQNFQALDMEK